MKSIHPYWFKICCLVFIIFLFFFQKAKFERSSCFCKSRKSGKTYDFCYENPRNPESIGAKFNCNLLDTLEELGLISETERIPSLSSIINDESAVVFVSSTSDDHLHLSLKSYNSIREFYPHHKYILHGLNLSAAYIDKLPRNDENFEFRAFNTSTYPKFVSNWMTYNFKPLLMAQMLKEFPAVWWIDAHIGVVKPNIIGNLYEEIKTERLSDDYASVIAESLAPHSNFAVLNPKLLKFFPTSSLELLKQRTQVQAGLIFLARTRYTMKLFKWMVLCALTEDCMNPPGSQSICIFLHDWNKYYADCFRYDQSIINLLLVNDFTGIHKYYSEKLSSSFVRND
ncbi:Nucleotid_trans domain-containing protein [Caenorhabditis elegans]|uniref:Nucleotid_trans domain-containing protein n=1 Tax=Caenorhabditis elegans TaxID=6239 RepID=Q9XU71_CAEEL|nr:Nucleotid_trans domain-containing protein [Caenorhabditis elegans]CAB05619.2 Nucleotid_trans domain-containing protein [Caenorhabditis elegans]